MNKKIYVTMTDKYMSGWGCAAGKIDKFVVACDSWSDAALIERNAKEREEMMYVSISFNRPYYPKKEYNVTHDSFSELGAIWKRI